MSPIKMLVAAASVAALCSPAFAEPDAQAAHGWHMPTKEDMAAWHSQMCKDRYAHVAGRLAYLEASLSITDAQRSAFDQWRSAVLSQAKSHSEACLAHTAMPHGPGNALERNAEMQKHLQDRLASLQSERPALEALYQVLTPDQKKLFDREGGDFGGHRHMGEHFHMGEHMGERGPADHGPG